ncbi:MAG: glucosaminidase domain-containing protein [Sulfurimonas sp.]|uniref:glucosaminidase domain-containing protein n=1 Tax=Sulfurimonas sp. TaxID=2022749 RepID=UPI0025E78C2C|nr:glucosaminidase domain-containing protein [Sulfurimonas sp.]MCK9492089.1 glucosaminidase domain-containing protein [Sulfurimonas sp.]
MRFLKIILLAFVLVSSDSLLAKDAKPISVKEKKKRFFNTLVPVVNSVYKELDIQYKEIKTNLKNPKYKKKITTLKKIYKVKTDKDLMMALKPHPRSITLAQAAMESAWGTSRFYIKANNIFGVWSFNKKEPRIAASQKRGKKTIWLKKYPTIKDSVRDYYKNISRSHAFVEFRKLKMVTDDPYKLVKKLDRYSEMKEKYPKELAAMIRYNKLQRYDKP